jgi:anthranilate phosphoribosyltransferase
VAELHPDGEIEEYVLDYKDLGLPTAKEEVILCKLNKGQEAIELLRVLSGEDHNSRRDIVCLNTAPILYITGHAKDLEEGVRKAEEIIDSGKAIKKLRQWVAEQQSGDSTVKVEQLDRLIEKSSALVI